MSTTSSQTYNRAGNEGRDVSIDWTSVHLPLDFDTRLYNRMNQLN